MGDLASGIDIEFRIVGQHPSKQGDVGGGSAVCQFFDKLPSEFADVRPLVKDLLFRFPKPAQELGDFVNFLLTDIQQDSGFPAAQFVGILVALQFIRLLVILGLGDEVDHVFHCPFVGDL